MKTCYSSGRSVVVWVCAISLVACGVGRRQIPEINRPITGSGGEDGLLRLDVPDDPTVSLKVWFRVGSQNDPPGKEGLAWLTGRLLEEGATTRNEYEAILRKLYPLAAGYDVRVDREMTVISGRAHKDKLDDYYELFADAWLRPAFRESDFRRLQTDALNFLRNTLRYESDEELGKAALYSFVFEGTPYAHPPQGTVEGLTAINLADVRDFYQRHFTRGNTVPALAGGIDSEISERLERDVASLPIGGVAPAPEISMTGSEGRQVLLVHKPDGDASISFGFPLSVRRGDRDYYALWIANSWLGEHRNSASHLFEVIRERRGLNYGDYSYIEAFTEGGRRQFPPPHIARRQQLFEVWVRTLPRAQAAFALRAALREVERLHEQGMTQEQFELTRSFLSKYVLHFADTTSARLGYAVDDRFYSIGAPGHLARFREMMDQLTLTDVNAAIRRHLDPSRLKIAIVTGDAESLAAALRQGTPSPIVYPTPKSQEILDEDATIAAWPIKVAAGAVRIVPVEQMFQR